MSDETSRRKKPAYQIKIANERIAILLNEAVNIHKERPDLARRYFSLAKKIGMRYNVSIHKQMKRKFCKHCFSYLSEGWRFKKGRAYVKCKNCGRILIYPYKPKGRKR